MEKKEQKEKIDQFLKSRYGLSLGNWVSLNELIVSGETLDESIWRVKEFLKDNISEKAKEISDHIGMSKFQLLRNDLILDWEDTWKDLLLIEDEEIDDSEKKPTVDYLNIYHENSEKIKEYYNEMTAIYNSIKKGISAEEELNKFFEIAKLDFHTIPLNKNKGEKYLFLKGFMKGLDYGKDIVKNRSQPIQEQADTSTSFGYY